MLSQSTNAPQTAQNQDIQHVVNPYLHLHALLVGFGFLVFALTTSFLLYRTFGHTETEKNVYAVMGVLLCLSTALSLKMSYVLWLNQNAVLSVICFVLYCSLFYIEWNTTLGFTATSQTHVKENSKAAALVDEQLKIADEKLQALAQYRNLSSSDIDSRKQKAETELNALNQRLSACPATYRKNCIEPLENQISSVKAELAKLNADVINASQYQAALAQKEQLFQMTMNTSAATANSYHPLFIAQSAIFNRSPGELESKFLGFSSLIVTVLTSLLFLLSSVLKHRFILIPVTATKHDTQALQQNTSGKIGLFDALKNALIAKIENSKKP